MPATFLPPPTMAQPGAPAGTIGPGALPGGSSGMQSINASGANSQLMQALMLAKMRKGNYKAPLFTANGQVTPGAVAGTAMADQAAPLSLAPAGPGPMGAMNA